MLWHVQQFVFMGQMRSTFVFWRRILMPGEEAAYESSWSASQTDRADKLSRSEGAD